MSYEIILDPTLRMQTAINIVAYSINFIGLMILVLDISIMSKLHGKHLYRIIVIS